jgi:hypothetical protein
LVQRAPLGLSAAIDGALRAARCLVMRYLHESPRSNVRSMPLRWLLSGIRE